MLPFSQRIGKTQVKTTIQSNGIDSDLKNGIWNAIYLCILKPLQNKYDVYFSSLPDEDAFFLTRVWINFFKQRLDERPQLTPAFESYIKKFIFSCEWFRIYEFIEFTINNHRQGDAYNHQIEQFVQYLNSIFKEELAGYRIIDKLVSPVISEVEINSITESLNLDDAYSPVRIHLSSALELLSKKTNPDYRNSIKESISAVESLCSIISKNPKATLGDALKELETKYNLHSALKSSFQKLYGYTSDANGIRHALGLTEEGNINQEDAIYILVSCSAFTNYLIKKIEM